MSESDFSLIQILDLFTFKLIYLLNDYQYL